MPFMGNSVLRIKNNLCMHLLYIEDFIKRYPEKRLTILDDEIHHRERELLLYTSAYTLVRLHIFASLRVILGAGLSVFLLVWSLSQLAQLAQSFVNFQNAPFGLSERVGELLFSTSTRLLSSTMSSSGLVGAFYHLDWQDAASIGFAVTIVIFLEKCIVGFFAYRRSRALKSGLHELEEEIEILKKLRNKRVPRADT